MGKSVPVDHLVLLDDLVHIIWEWDWDEDGSQHSQDMDSEGHSATSDHLNKYLDSSSEDSDEEPSDPIQDFVLPEVTHTVTFKSVGVTHDPSAQKILKIVAQLLSVDEKVEVRITPEPTNVHDARAICFRCHVDGKWHRIGYIVREALDYVHAAMAENKILSVSFAWVKYMSMWKSGPGFYAGIKIAKNGEWHPDIVKCSSTR